MDRGELQERRLVVAANRGPVSFHSDPSGRADRHARPRRPRDRAHRGAARAPRHLGRDGARRRGVAARRAGALRRRRARRRRLPGALRLRGRGRLRQVLQHRRQPDPVVHPALPVGPRAAPGHLAQRARRLGERLPPGPAAVRGGDRRRSWRRQAARRRRGGRDGRRVRRPRHAARLPPLRRRAARACRPARRLPAAVRAHPLGAERLVAGAAQGHAHRRLRRPARQRHRRLPHAALRA